MSFNDPQTWCRGIRPLDALKKDSRGLCRGAAGNPRVPRNRLHILQVWGSLNLFTGEQAPILFLITLFHLKCLLLSSLSPSGTPNRQKVALSGKESAQGCLPKRLIGRPDEALGGGNQGPSAPGWWPSPVRGATPSPCRGVWGAHRSCLFATPRTAARQASLSITNSQSLLKFMSIELVMPSNHLRYMK